MFVGEQVVGLGQGLDARGETGLGLGQVVDIAEGTPPKRRRAKKAKKLIVAAIAPAVGLAAGAK